MSVVEGNVLKFLEDHKFPDKERAAILEKFRDLRENYGFPIIPAGLIPRFMDGRAEEFLKEVLTIEKHKEIYVLFLRRMRMIMRVITIIEKRMEILTGKEVKSEIKTV